MYPLLESLNFPTDFPAEIYSQVFLRILLPIIFASRYFLRKTGVGKSAVIPEDFAAVIISQSKFPADPIIVGTSAGNNYFLCCGASYFSSLTLLMKIWMADLVTTIHENWFSARYESSIGPTSRAMAAAD
ncbi:hypothetical protein MTR_8g077760 [Medicago truncatula]|uniref:Uncharacterized protein n=1 Tax=Medicago truncatula TaxID=3880 RepID=G7LET5_MEDTR|nr:hypothetical protein MTR_8g077760 [Medicago truncatula]